jgi:hypothetical protein
MGVWFAALPAILRPLAATARRANALGAANEPGSCPPGSRLPENRISVARRA